MWLGFRRVTTGPGVIRSAPRSRQPWLDVVVASGRVRKWCLIVGFAVAVRVVLALTLKSNGDIHNMQIEESLLQHRPSEAYSGQPSFFTWPYLTGYFPILLGIDAISGLTGGSFAAIARLATTGANLGLVWLVNDELRYRGFSYRSRSAAALMLLFSPLLVLESGWHGQLDLAATLCAVGGIVAWGRAGIQRRALVAGLLIGLALAIKTVPGIVVLALVPHARGRRELMTLLAATAAVPLLGAAPWLWTDHHSILERLTHYHGLAGLGGLSLLAQPRTAQLWLNGTAVPFSSLQVHLQAHGGAFVLVGLAVGTVVLIRYKPAPAVGAVLLFLIVYATAVNWTQYYLVWVLPFLLLAGWIRLSVAFQIILSLPVAMVYGRAILHPTFATPPDLWSTGVTMGVYVPVMLALWAATVLGAVVLVRRFNAGVIRVM